MTQTAFPALPSDTSPSDLPERALEMLSSDGRPRGLLFADGRVAALGPAMLRAMGFAADDDLRGLPFDSFWRHGDRPAIGAALRAARREGRASVDLDLAYVGARSGHSTVTLSPAPVGGLLVAVLHSPDAMSA
ncbi:hypothetical protein [Jannaschia rubra]|uniref:PAS fold protein n=1 Tax=Jannaschia rubra TaxID=282197 RepID=A0A0M6XM09_9RHOB|nr:hypothetical protein [Jannaschia rubra]CTQ32129.1 hypothetical protein JAN5088_00892 [Jannaschia rubra]SFG36934.1 hypothetical protein SAMN04488517_104101 [Jannaschia rubra]